MRKRADCVAEGHFLVRRGGHGVADPVPDGTTHRQALPAGYFFSVSLIMFSAITLRWIWLVPS